MRQVYHGLDGAQKWLNFLTQFIFNDFKIVSMSPGYEPDKVSD